MVTACWRFSKVVTFVLKFIGIGLPRINIEANSKFSKPTAWRRETVFSSVAAPAGLFNKKVRS